LHEREDGEREERRVDADGAGDEEPCERPNRLEFVFHGCAFFLKRADSLDENPKFQ